MSSTAFGLTPGQVAELFPFHLCFDHDLVVRQVGRAWTRVDPRVAVGSALDAVARLVRPEGVLNWELLRSQPNSVFILETHGTKLSLRGQMLPTAASDAVLFLCAPWVTNLQEVERLGLALADFPSHQTVADYLFLLQTKDRARSDARHLADQLSRQRSELRTTNRDLAEARAQLEVDVRTRALAEQKLQRSEERLRLVLDTSLDAVIQMNAQGIVIGWNRQAESTFGWARHEALGRVLAELIIPPAFREAHLAGLQRYLDSGEGRVLNARVEVEALHRDGQRFPVELTVSPLKHNQRIEFNAFVRDITESKRAAQALEQAKEAAEAASEAKSRFLAMISHEMRTPLNPIIGMTGVLLDEGLTRTQRQHVERIRQSGLLLLQRINEVLDFSKVEAGRIELEEIDFDPVDAIEQTRDLFHSLATEKGIDLRLQVDPATPRQASGDLARFQQVVSNLLSNAIKFTEHGYVTLSVTPVALGPTLRIEVTDTGPGIPPESVPHLFEAFTQADASMTRRFGGSGLGLAIARDLVQLMGGDIGVTANPEGGSRFWFSVTLKPPTGRAAEVVDPLAPASPPARHSARMRPLRILLAEDNSANQEVATLMLERLGHRVDIVSNGSEAVTAVARQPYDILLMDCQMPEMDGFEATKSIRKQQGTDRHTVIIAMTAYAIKGDRERCLNAGMDDYLTKPVTMETLAAALERNLEKATGQAIVIDYSVLDQLAKLETAAHPDVRQRLIEHLLRRLPAAWHELSDAVRRDDWSAVERTAHDLKAEFGNVGGREISALCGAIQEAARNGDARRCPQLIQRYAHEAQQVAEELTRYLEQLRTPT